MIYILFKNIKNIYGKNIICVSKSNIYVENLWKLQIENILDKTLKFWSFCVELA